MTLGIAILAPLLGCSGGGCGSKTISIAPDPTDSAATTEQIAGTGDPWLRDEVASPGSITFSEIHYHPASGDDAEWIELHNPMALDVDLSGWSLAEGVAYTFPEGTVIAAGDLLVVSGPWDGDLADDGETIELRNNGGRRIDAVTYGDDDPWPVAPDGSGLSLAKMDAGAASDHAESWTASAQLGGTPGEPNLLDPLAPATTVELVPLGATWRYDVSGAYPASDWASPDHDDGAWLEGAAVFYAGEAVGAVAATAWVTADNFYAIYLGGADGSDLRAVGEDVDGNWWTVDAIELEVSPSDHLYLAAWEAPGDAGGPQMTIAEVELPDDVVGTDATAFEWVLGPTDGCPGTMPGVEPPADEEIAALVASAAWAAPAVEADRASDPWGWALAGSFDAGTTYVWGDTFGDSSVTNTENTYALFRSVEPLLGPRGATELTDLPTTTTFRTSFTLDADPAAAELFLACLVDDGAVVYLNGVEVLRENVPDGVVDAGT
ncbi:MAG: lamin tail domain-containing protein, partial [Myxococcota bacterium]